MLVCVLWGNNSLQQGVSLVLCKQNCLLVGDRRCMFCIHLRHKHFNERFEIIFFHDVFRDDPFRDPKIFIFNFVVEGSDEINV